MGLPLPPDTQRIIPALSYDDASTAIEFLCRAFGFAESSRLEHARRDDRPRRADPARQHDHAGLRLSRGRPGRPARAAAPALVRDGLRGRRRRALRTGESRRRGDHRGAGRSVLRRPRPTARWTPRATAGRSTSESRRYRMPSSKQRSREQAASAAPPTRLAAHPPQVSQHICHKVGSTWYPVIPAPLLRHSCAGRNPPTPSPLPGVFCKMPNFGGSADQALSGRHPRACARSAILQETPSRGGG